MTRAEKQRRWKRAQAFARKRRYVVLVDLIPRGAYGRCWHPMELASLALDGFRCEDFYEDVK